MSHTLGVSLAKVPAKAAEIKDIEIIQYGTRVCIFQSRRRLFQIIPN